jgi:hypothetical protein
MMALALIAGLMLAQAPAALQTPMVQPPAAVKPKPKQVCELIEVTGSRTRRRVCVDESNTGLLGFGIANGAPNSAMARAAKTFGSLGTPVRAERP